MARQQKLSVIAMLDAMDSLTDALKATGAKPSAAAVTKALADNLGMSVSDCEKRYKRFAAKPEYETAFSNFETAIPLEFVTVGKQGAPKVDANVLAKYADKFRKAAE